MEFVKIMSLAYLNERLMQINEQIAANKRRLATLPEGKIIATKNGNSQKWIVSKDGKKEYLPKSEERMAKYLTKRRLLEYENKHLEDELIVIRSFIRYHKKVNMKEQLLSNVLYSKIIPLEYREISIKVDNWKKEKYIQNQSNQHIISTSEGFNVKTRSEEAIVMFLSSHKIPFRYEEQLIIQGEIVYSQFSIMNTNTGKVFYLEYLENYKVLENYSNFLYKLSKYEAYGIVPGINLMIIYEGSDLDFRLKYFENHIRLFL